MRLLIYVLGLLISAPAASQSPGEPIIDMHLHAEALADYGPSPVPMCTPFPEMPTWDQRGPYSAVIANRAANPPCKNPVWPPATDAQVMRDTIAAMRRRNIYGVLSGEPKRVAAWRKAAPGRFWSGLGFRLSRDLPVARLAQLHRDGQLDVL